MKKETETTEVFTTKKAIPLWFLISGAILIFLLFSSLKIVPAGTVGVKDLFGIVDDKELQPGVSFVIPLTSVKQFSTRTLSDYQIISALTKEGLSVEIDITVLWHIIPEDASDIYKNLGENYQQLIIHPQIRSVAREVMSNYQAKNIYTKTREELQKNITNQLTPLLENRGLILEQVLIRDVRLPDQLVNAIEQKLTQEQQIERKRFEVETEQQEAERRRIEAQGIADANEIISDSLSQEYLTWYWINQLSEQQNVIYVPTGQNGLPLFKTIE